MATTNERAVVAVRVSTATVTSAAALPPRDGPLGLRPDLPKLGSQPVPALNDARSSTGGHSPCVLDADYPGTDSLRTSDQSTSWCGGRRHVRGCR